MAKENRKEAKPKRRDWPFYVTCADGVLGDIRALCSKYLQDPPPTEPRVLEELCERLTNEVAFYYAEQLAADLAQVPSNERLQGAQAMFYNIFAEYIYNLPIE